MLRSLLDFSILTTVLSSVFAIDSSILKCSELRNNDKLICVVFDLQIYHEMTKIKQIDDGMYGIKFDALYLMSPLVYYLPTNIFSHFPNITELKIVTDIPALLELESTFSNLNQLKTIQIINQKLKKLDSEEFEGAKKVTSLLLTSNEIERIHDDAFLGLNECRFLDLRNNRLRVIRGEALRHMPKLWSVNLGNNRIFTLFQNMFENNAIIVADFSYNLVRVVESMSPIEKVLKAKDQKALFSLRYQLCKRFGPKAVFTPKSILEQIKSKVEACQLYYTLPSYCHNYCRSCVRYDLISEEDEGDYDENDNWDGGVFGGAVPLPNAKPKLRDEDDPSYEMVSLKAENLRLRSFCMSGNFSGSVTVFPSGNGVVAQTCSSKISSMATVVNSVQNLLNDHQSALQGVVEELTTFSQQHSGEAKASNLKPADADVVDLTMAPKEIETTSEEVTSLLLTAATEPEVVGATESTSLELETSANPEPESGTTDETAER